MRFSICCGFKMLSEFSNLSQDDYFGRRFVGKFQQVEKGKLSGLGSQSGDSYSARQSGDYYYSVLWSLRLRARRWIDEAIETGDRSRRARRYLRTCLRYG